MQRREYRREQFERIDRWLVHLEVEHPFTFWALVIVAAQVVLILSLFIERVTH
jgi:hypothetical protein